MVGFLDLLSADSILKNITAKSAKDSRSAPRKTAVGESNCATSLEGGPVRQKAGQCTLVRSRAGNPLLFLTGEVAS
jgi:hypothetical protein